MWLMRMARTVLVVFLLLAGACGRSEIRSAPVTTSPAPSAPEEVVLAYLAAIDRNDVETARRFLSPAHAAVVERQRDSWFTNVESLTDVQIRRVEPDPGGVGNVRVLASFVLRQKEAMSFADGGNTWGFVLQREGADTWLIDSEGMG